MSIPLQAFSLDEPYQTDPCQVAHAVFPSPVTLQPMEGQVPLMRVLGEVPGYFGPFMEYRENQSRYEYFTENLAGMFLEDHPVDTSSRCFNQYPHPTNTWGMGYTTDTTLVDSPVGPSFDLAPAGHQPPPPPSTSTTGPRPQKLYNCTYCGTLFDRYSRARDCRNMDLGLTLYHCLGKCGTVGCPVAYGSEALLLEHTKPRAVQCPSCPRTLSKKNMARHQKKFCSGRNLPAGPSTTGVEN